MKNTFYPQQYKCPKCKEIQSHYIWSNERKDTKRICDCGEILTHKNEYSEPKPELPSIKTPTKNRF
jgi:hypothetical protein